MTFTIIIFYFSEHIEGTVKKYKLLERSKSVMKTGEVQHEYHKRLEQNRRNVQPPAIFFGEHCDQI